jgi:hypothetical protein
MIIGAEIGLLVLGVYALIVGKLPTNKKSKYVLRGWPVRLIGIIAVLPIPMSFLVASMVAAFLVVQGKEVTRESFFWVGTAIEGSVLVICIAVIAVLSRLYRRPIEPPRAESEDP